MLKITVLCAMFLFVDAAIVKRQATTTTPPPNILENFQTNINQLRNCIDQNLASVLGQVNEQQIQPVINAVGDTLNRVSKAFEDLTATTNSLPQGGK